MPNADSRYYACLRSFCLTSRLQWIALEIEPRLVMRLAEASNQKQISYYKVRDAEWVTGLERAPPVRVQLEAWLKAPSLNRWLTPRP